MQTFSPQTTIAPTGSLSVSPLPADRYPVVARRPYLVVEADGDGRHAAHHLPPVGAPGQRRVVAHLVSLQQSTGCRRIQPLRYNTGYSICRRGAKRKVLRSSQILKPYISSPSRMTALFSISSITSRSYFHCHVGCICASAHQGCLNPMVGSGTPRHSLSPNFHLACLRYPISGDRPWP